LETTRGDIGLSIALTIILLTIAMSLSVLINLARKST